MGQQSQDRKGGSQGPEMGPTVPGQGVLGLFTGQGSQYGDLREPKESYSLLTPVLKCSVGYSLIIQLIDFHSFF